MNAIPLTFRAACAVVAMLFSPVSAFCGYWVYYTETVSIEFQYQDWNYNVHGSWDTFSPNCPMPSWATGNNCTSNFSFDEYSNVNRYHYKTYFEWDGIGDYECPDPFEWDSDEHDPWTQMEPRYWDDCWYTEE
jgi:hypothetical protein